MKRNKWLAIFMFYIPLIQTNRQGKPRALRPELYGPYDALIKKAEPCPPHERVDYKNYTLVEGELMVLSKSEIRLRGNYWYERDTYMDDIKTIEMFVWRNETRRLLLTRTVKDSCNDLVFRPMLIKYVNMDNDCLVKRGYYSVTALDLNKVLHMYLGDTIFYGKYMIRIDAENEIGRVGCMQTVFEFCPIQKKTKRRRMKNGK